LRLDQLTSQHRHALGFPWVFPRDPSLVAACETLRCTRPAPPKPGDTALLAVRPDQASSEATLWALHHGTIPPGARTFLTEARHSRTVARAIAAAELAAIVAPNEAQEDPGASAIFLGGSGVVQALDGASFGLSFCLAEASRLLKRGLPADLIATCALDSDGTPIEVGGLHAKMERVVDTALGVERVLVAECQQERAQEFLDAGAKRGNVQAPRAIGIRTLASAFEAAFGDVSASLIAQWRVDMHAAERAVRALFRIALDGSRTIIWKGAAETAGALHAVLSEAERPVEAERARITQLIMLRHNDRPKLIPWPTDARDLRLKLADRIKLAAHALQSATDGEADDQELARRTELASEMIRDRDAWRGEELRLAGAVGRALAAGEDFVRAKAWLRDTIEGWFDAGLDAEASYSACEYARVVGILGEQAEVERLAAEVFPRIAYHHAASPLSALYLRLALGRALAQASRPEEARIQLADDEPWHGAHPGLQAARRRWLARVLGALRDSTGQAHVWAAIEQKAGLSPDTDTNALLAQADAARERADPAFASRILDALEKHPGGQVDVRRFRVRHPGDASDPISFAALVGERWRY
jgi:hypothetical protein